MLRVVTPATVEPVSLEELKGRIRIDGDAFDALLPSMVAASREVVERQTGYALAEASYEWTPEGDRTSPLPIMPGTVTSADGEYPIMFTTKPGPAPAALVAAICLLVADMVANIEANSDKPLTENPALQTLMFPFRRMMP